MRLSHSYSIYDVELGEWVIFNISGETLDILADATSYAMMGWRTKVESNLELPVAKA